MMRTRPTRDDLRWYHLTIGSLILAAWGLLAYLGTSPYAHLFHHMGAGHGDPVVRTGVFMLGWALMTVAMMLPITLPLVNHFRQSVQHRPDRDRLAAQLVVGYLLVWVVFGGLVHLAGTTLYQVVEQDTLLASAMSRSTAAVLLMAGVYQFMPTKRACLAHCRSLHAPLERQYADGLSGRDAVRLGMRHGQYCLGSCWGLMLLMFVVSGSHLVWMLGLTLMMAVERTNRWGQRLIRPLGVVLLVWAIVLLTGYLPLVVV